MGRATTSSAGYRDSLRSRPPTPSSSFRWWVRHLLFRARGETKSVVDFGRPPGYLIIGRATPLARRILDEDRLV
jgi:hypothetical protein